MFLLLNIIGINDSKLISNLIQALNHVFDEIIILIIELHITNREVKYLEKDILIKVFFNVLIVLVIFNSKITTYAFFYVYLFQ